MQKITSSYMAYICSKKYSDNNTAPKYTDYRVNKEDKWPCNRSLHTRNIVVPYFILQQNRAILEELVFSENRAFGK